MGTFATQGGLSPALFAFANSLVGHVRGGIAMASVLACAAFARCAALRWRPAPP
jgi:TRAP-type C4-dicarboxylate transport system permease large subunit